MQPADELAVIEAELRYNAEAIKRHGKDMCLITLKTTAAAAAALAQARADRAEQLAVASKCDGRPESFLKLLEDRAKELQPDYPYTKHDAFEWLWALTSSLEGTNLANDDLHKELAAAHAEAGELARALEPFAKFAERFDSLRDDYEIVVYKITGGDVDAKLILGDMRQALLLFTEYRAAHPEPKVTK